MILENSAIEIVCNYLAKTETKRASIFGSYARGEAIQSRELENLLGKKVDLLTPASISPYIFPKIQKDLKLIYERK